MLTLPMIREARERLRSLSIPTPVLEDPSGTGLRFKAEHLQRTGSFKLRGAANRVLQAVQGGARHVITASSGNHGQAVAYVAQTLGIRATIVVPEDGVAVKLEGMRRAGAQVEFCGRTSQERIDRAHQIAGETGGLFIPPYDDLLVMAGQGTAGLEILEQAPDVEVVFVPIGGGGLISGVATAIKESRPGVSVVGVEPATANDTYLSRQSGARVAIGASSTIADGLRASQPGEMTFPIIQRYVDDLVLVQDDEILAAVRYMLREVRQVVEPSGAASVAAALKYGGGRRAVALVSGGNVDSALLRGEL